MATSDVQICNSALIKVGTDLIITLEEDNKRARVCKHQYPLLRDEVLRAHPWNFATARVQLAEVLPAPTFGEYEKWFELPDDCLRVLNIINGDGLKWAVEGDKLLVNTDSVNIRYIKRVTDTTLYDANFTEVLATRIAADLAWSLVQDAEMQEKIMAQYNRLVRPARSYDAQEGSAPKVSTSTWLSARY